MAEQVANGRAGRGHAVARACGVAAVAAGAAVGTLAVRAIRRSDVHLVRTASGPALVRTVSDPDGVPVRVLQQGGVFQSATYLDERRFEPVFTYYRGFDAMFEAEDAMRSRTNHGIRRVLMFGGGGYAYPKYLLTSRSNVRLDVVEIDPAVTEVARRWFFLGELKLRLANPALAQGNELSIYTADGRSYLEAAGLRGARYDAIVNDAFEGCAPVRRLATVEAVRLAKARLTLGGLYLVNVVSENGGEDLSFLRDEVATLRQAFRNVYILDVTDERFGLEANYLVVATDGAYTFPESIPYDEEFLGHVLTD